MRNSTPRMSQIYLWFAVILFIIATGCSGRKGAQETDEDTVVPTPTEDTEGLEISIPSLSQIYPLMLTEALKWDEDAGLYKITIDLFQVSEEQGEISAFFRSPNLPSERLFVDYFLTGGSINTKTTQLHFPLEEFYFIQFEDVIDSQKAWEIFSQQPQVVAHAKEDFECGKLILIQNSAGTQVFWRLAIGGKCGNSEQTFYHINAYTGEFLEP